MEIYTNISCTFQSLPYCFTIMFCVLLLFSGLLFGTISAQYGGYPNIRRSSPYLSSSFRSAGAYSSYSPHHGGKFSKGRTQILPMPYPYPYPYGNQRRRRPLVLRTGRRRNGGFLGGGGFGGGGFGGGGFGGGKYFMYYNVHISQVHSCIIC